MPGDSLPIYLPTDRTLSLAVEHLTRIYLENHAEETRRASEDREEGDVDSAPPKMPTLDHVALREYLSDHLEISAASRPMLKAYKGSLVALKTMSLLSTEAVLDLALLRFLAGRGTVSTTALYVNDPAVMGIVNKRPPGPHEVLLCPFRDFYSERQIEADNRADALVGVIQWQGFYLCRPALVALEDIEDSLVTLPVLSYTKAPTVEHIHLFGAH